VFGATWTPLPRPVKLYLADGRLVSADKYAVVTIVIDGAELSPPETVLILNEFVEEVEIEGKRIRMPDTIIGAGTIDKYNIVLDPKEGIKILGAGPPLSTPFIEFLAQQHRDLSASLKPSFSISILLNT